MEYLLYGIPKDLTEIYTEALLAVRATREDAESVIPLAQKDGFHGFRIATYAGEAPNFGRNVLA